MSRAVGLVLAIVAACGGGGGTAGNDAGNDAGSDAPLPQTGCGDGVASGAEMCDGSDLRGRVDCRDLGYYDAEPLTCGATCELVTSQCTGSCGDGIVQPDHELCDGADPASTCTDYGFGAGAVTCARCGPDFGDCRFFGWHRDYLPFTPSSLAGTSDIDVWAVGGGGTMHWDGARWQAYSLPSACGLAGATFDAAGPVAPGDVWLGAGETIVHVTPTTCDRFTLGNPNSVMVASIIPLAPDDVWLRGFSTVWHYDGHAWMSFDVMLDSMWAAGHDDIYGVSSSNEIRHFDGTSWTTTTLAAQRALHTIWGTGPHDIYAGGINYASSSPYVTSVIEHYDGNTWSETPIDELIEQNDSVTSIAGAAGRVFIGLHNTNAVRVVEPSGFAVLAAPELRAQTQILALPSGHLFVLPTGFPQVFRFDGTDEHDVSLGAPSSVAPVSAAEIYAVIPSATSAAQLSRFNGWFWRQDTSVSFVRSVVTALSGDVLLLAADGLHTRTGSAWSAPVSGFTSGDLLWAASPSDVWLRGSALDTLHHWNGANEVACASCTFTASQVWGTSASDLYALDYPSTFKHWDGTAWTDAPAPPTFHPTVLFGWAANDIVALDDAGALWHFDGAAWTPQPFPYPNLRPRYLWGTSLHDLFVANHESAVFHFDGARWSPVNIPGAFQISGIAGVGDTAIFFDGPAHHLVRTVPWN